MKSSRCPLFLSPRTVLTTITVTFALSLILGLPADAQDGEHPPAFTALQGSIAALKNVGPEGAGNTEAAKAWAALTADADAAALPLLLEALNDASPLAANWIRSAVQVILEREQAAGRELPLADIGATLLDSSGGVTGRVMAFDIIEQIQPGTAEQMVPGFLGDPSRELRRKAIARLITQAAALPEDEAAASTLLYRQALNAATDVDQVQSIAAALEKNGSPTDLPRHFGFLTHWNVVAAFDNTDRSGFDVVFPPENGVDLSDSYTGKGDTENLKWQPFASTDPYGKIDFNQPFGALKGATGYAYTEFDSATDRPAELRIGCKNGWKVWFNGELLFGRDEYHRGQRIDQYRMPVQLKAGKNTVLVKLCQDEQEQSWTVEWEFQLRVCDTSGTAILAPDRLPTPVKATPSRRGAGAKDTRGK